MLKGVTKTIKNEAKAKTTIFKHVLGTSRASLLGDMLAGKGIVRTGYENKERKGMLRAEYESKK